MAKKFPNSRHFLTYRHSLRVLTNYTLIICGGATSVVLSIWLINFLKISELCIYPLSEASSRLSNHPTWKGYWAPQHSKWYDVLWEGYIPATAGCWWGPKRYKCNLLYWYLFIFILCVVLYLIFYDNYVIRWWLWSPLAL